MLSWLQLVDLEGSFAEGLSVLPCGSKAEYCAFTAAVLSIGAIPIPGLPHGPTNPFTYSVLGSAVVHLLAQTVVFGAAAVLVDIGLMQILRRAWAGMHKPVHKHHHPQHSSQRASQDSQREALAGKAWVQYDAVADAENGDVGLGGSRLSMSGVDADVAAERVAVEEGQSLTQAMVSNNKLAVGGHCCSRLGRVQTASSCA